MWKYCAFVVAIFCVTAGAQKNGDELVTSVVNNCADMGCVKLNVLRYLDNLLQIKGDSARNLKNIDAAIFTRAAKVLKTNEFRIKLPQMFFDNSEMVYSPKTGLDIETYGSESRDILKKKLLLPFLLLFKLKTKLLMPIFVALIGLKSLKALILSKLAIGIVLGFVIYQLCTKAGMPMPMMMNMPPVEPPAPLYGPPSTTPVNTYDPSYDPTGANMGGPYQRIWTPNNDPQSVVYPAYYAGSTGSSTPRP